MVQNSARVVVPKATCYVNILSPDKENPLAAQVQEKKVWEPDYTIIKMRSFIVHSLEAETKESQ